MPTIFSGPLTGAPSTRTVPAVGGTRPVTSFIKDDLPQPDGPTTAANWPRSMDIVAPFKATVPSAVP
jgi:hypothetical protein